MERFVLRDSKDERVLGYISKDTDDDYDPHRALRELEAERTRREEEQKRRKEIRAKQKPARMLVKTLLWVTLLIGIQLGGGKKAHEKLGFALIGVAIVGFFACGSIFVPPR